MGNVIQWFSLWINPELFRVKNVNTNIIVQIVKEKRKKFWINLIKSNKWWSGDPILSLGPCKSALTHIASVWKFSVWRNNKLSSSTQESSSWISWRSTSWRLPFAVLQSTAHLPDDTCLSSLRRMVSGKRIDLQVSNRFSDLHFFITNKWLAMHYLHFNPPPNCRLRSFLAQFSRRRRVMN